MFYCPDSESHLANGLLNSRRGIGNYYLLISDGRKLLFGALGWHNFGPYHIQSRDRGWRRGHRIGGIELLYLEPFAYEVGELIPQE